MHPLSRLAKVPRVLVCALALCWPASLVAQEIAAPADWTIRSDLKQSPADSQFRYARMPPGWHMTTLTSGVSMLPRGRSVDGAWGVEVELYVFPKPSDEPLGIIVEAADRVPGAEGLQFLMRADGAASLVAVHDSTTTVLVPWTHDTAIAPHNGTGIIKYVLRVMHQGERLTFAINGTQLFSVASTIADRRMVPGLRLGAGLNVHVSRFDLVTPLAPAAEVKRPAS